MDESSKTMSAVVLPGALIHLKVFGFHSGWKMLDVLTGICFMSMKEQVEQRFKNTCFAIHAVWHHVASYIHLELLC